MSIDLAKSRREGMRWNILNALDTPAESFQSATLVSRIMALDNVTDVDLTPSSNVEPTVDWMYVYWLRAGAITVSAAS
ncbi:hypothetical protein [Acinetobacter sp. ANC 3791]|uniref:hypothetical protein n=1 Tax=Acinetobacter sp. ANC 3791 TaxID=2529836 RepID=UPI00103A964E|nr:hypothetical protein [Acinetobacter sp. ANC 3791]TCB83658.1 hypothetical protein E0H90_11010 [Acinetobacter sp. ANC 3791]